MTVCNIGQNTSDFTVDVRLNAKNLTNKSNVASCVSLNFCYLGEERNIAATISDPF